MASTNRSWWRRWRQIVIGLLALQAAYVGSYAALYHRGVSEADEFGSKYFFYVPVTDVVEARGVTRQHMLLMALYEPLNDLHGRWLGGRSPCGCILFELSAEPSEPRTTAADRGVTPDGGPSP
jgi:hypothetical protein